jgi:formylglycine-generating enzyme required for sulfatase activity
VGGYKADDLVIAVTRKEATVPGGSSSVDVATIEYELWNAIKESKDPEDYQAFLKEFPNGRFAGVARNRIRQLEAAAKPSLPTRNPTGAPPPSAGVGRQENVDLQTYTETAGGAAVEMVRVPGGKFTMGSPDSEAGRFIDEGPQHTVSISSFYLGKYEVTQAQWRAVANLPKVKIDLNPDPSNFKGDNLPVEQVGWEEAIEFCDRLSQATGKTYRLPTAAEWEYAARAATTGPYAGNLDSMGWYDRNADGKTHPAGTKQANGFGLYDMHGNVWEWCMDWYSEEVYGHNPIADPKGPATGSQRVNRGGSWYSDARHCRSANRNGNAPTYRDGSIGFRLVRTLQ